MSTATAALFAVIFLVSAGNLQADEAAEYDALRKIKALYEEVVSSDDLTRLLPYLPDKLTAVTPTGEEIRSPQQLQAYFHKIWEMIGKQGAYEVKVNVENTELYGDLAVSYGTTDERVRTAAGKEFRFPMLWTAVTRKDADQWKMVRMHGSIDPLGNVFVKTQLRLTRWMYGAGGVVVGLGVGLLLGLRRRSRT